MLSNDVPRRGLGRRAAADAEGARDRAAPRLAARRRRRAAAHRARARRGACARSSRACASRRSARSSSEEHISTIVLRRAPRGSRTATTACPRSRCSTPTLERRSPTTSSSGCASRRRRRASAARSTTASCRPRRASTSARSRSRRAAIPGQEPIARLHYRGKVNRRLRVLEVDGDRRPPETPVVYGEQGGRPRHERRRTVSRSPTCASRCRTTPSSTSAGAPARLHWPLRAPVAQGIERCPAEAEVASSNLAGRTLQLWEYRVVSLSDGQYHVVAQRLRA